MRPLHEGDAVVMKPMSLGKKEWSKGTIIRGAGRSYDIETQDGSVFRRNRVHLKKVPKPLPSSPTRLTEQPRPIPEPPVIQKVPENPKSPAQKAPAPTPEVKTEVRRSGRLVKKNQLQDFVY